MTYHITTVNTIKETLNAAAASVTTRFLFLLPSHYVPFAAANLVCATVTRDKVDFCCYADEDSDDTQLTGEI